MRPCDAQWLRDLKLVRGVSSFSIVHATLDAPDRWGYVFDKWAAAASFSCQTTALCFFGHTHVPLAFVKSATLQGGAYARLQIEPGRQYLVNVGSVGEPRGGNWLAAYVIYDAATGQIELRRVAYDLETTEAKIRQAGLPPRRKSL